ncbi:threonine/homoserine/homoserine lactone efflux protein [Paraburkholderia youngii]|uniref:LysE family translocator n=1 Tax=Paraburkholderia youngii TaxID=2782701 RepID=A0ABX2NNY1_9BURK|nr:LysE family translocator [Paraburkholderia youngii]NVI05913.1 LysE family translocator [Paraburkholderia youngii]
MLVGEKKAVEVSLLTAFWLVSFSLVLVPGADWAYAISAGLRERAIAPAIAGMLSGYLAITVVVAAGVGALVAKAPAVLAVLTFVGAGYLLWVGGNILARPAVPTVAAERAPGAALDWSIRGFAVSGLNPKALLLFLALLPQFTRATDAWSIPVQIGALGLLHMANCAVVYSVVGLGSKAVLRTRPSVARRVSQVSGAAMVLIAVLLFVEQLLAFK